MSHFASEEVLVLWSQSIKCVRVEKKGGFCPIGGVVSRVSVFSENPVPPKCHLSQSASFCQDPGIPSVDFWKTA